MPNPSQNPVDDWSLSTPASYLPFFSTVGQLLHARSLKKQLNAEFTKDALGKLSYEGVNAEDPNGKGEVEQTTLLPKDDSALPRSDTVLSDQPEEQDSKISISETEAAEKRLNTLQRLIVAKGALELITIAGFTAATYLYATGQFSHSQHFMEAMDRTGIAQAFDLPAGWDYAAVALLGLAYLLASSKLAQAIAHVADYAESTRSIKGASVGVAAAFTGPKFWENYIKFKKREAELPKNDDNADFTPNPRRTIKGG
ncbi:MAG: hypothetical protein QM752_01925 [Gammaproteobacteria bacterium]